MINNNIDINRCLVWRTDRAEMPSSSNQCYECKSGPCKFYDPSVLQKGRRKGGKKPNPQNPPAAGWNPRHRTLTGDTTRVVLFRTKAYTPNGELWHEYADEYDFVTDVKRMQEYSKHASRGNCVLAHHCWSNPDETIALSGRHDDPGGSYAKWEFTAAELQRHCLGILDSWVHGDDMWTSPLFGEYRMNEPWGPVSEVRELALKTMIPSLTTGFSLLNFALELVDFKSWFDGSDLRELVRAAKSVKDLNPRYTLAQLSNAAALGQLTWSFAIAPLLSDLTKLLDVLTNWRIRTEKFIQDSHRLESKRRFRRSVSKEGLEPLLTIPFPTGSPYEYLEARLRLEPLVSAHFAVTEKDHFAYTATMLFDYTVHQLVEMNSQLGGMFEQLGLKPDASIVWNAIPFSFLVDWFADISTWLHKNASIDMMSAIVTVHDWIESYRLRYSVDLHVRGSVPEGTTLHGFPLIGVAHGEVFLRRSVRPPDRASWEGITVDPGFKLQRVANAAALARRLSN